jgi:hypothetical protein
MQGNEMHRAVHAALGQHSNERVAVNRGIQVELDDV